MPLESDSSWLTIAGPYPMLPRLSASVSGVDSPPWIHANLSVRLSLSSRQLSSAGSRRQLSFAFPYHFRIRRDFMSKNPLSGFAPKQTRLLWRPTHIVLHLFVVAWAVSCLGIFLDKSFSFFFINVRSSWANMSCLYPRVETRFNQICYMSVIDIYTDFASNHKINVYFLTGLKSNIIICCVKEV